MLNLRVHGPEVPAPFPDAVALIHDKKGVGGRSKAVANPVIELLRGAHPGSGLACSHLEAGRMLNPKRLEAADLLPGKGTQGREDQRPCALGSCKGFENQTLARPRGRRAEHVLASGFAQDFEGFTLKRP